MELEAQVWGLTQESCELRCTCERKANLWQSIEILEHRVSYSFFFSKKNHAELHDFLGCGKILEEMS